ncbi:venom acid phosphatase Acph-1-like [Trichogramma pretiosum]|uniref:venom acid phosphatase Acph-1-like n=1 Tax=Trichogramma pretiosum TaxID=7493 RepID=UPI0006C9E567|nr:venom acid phosphatase Acph-1-like [Trichogramma pretiosum]
MTIAPLLLLLLCSNFWALGEAKGLPPLENVAKFDEDDYQLEMVQVLFRHGARTAIGCEAILIPNNSEAYYQPWGYSQLTNVGMKQEYRIGQMLRRRYDDFLGDQYRPRDVYAYSSDYSRTKASLELALASLYPPKGQQIWNPDLDWMPIAVNSNPRQLDILMKPRFCPKFITTLQRLYNTTEVRDTLREFADVIDLMKSRYENFTFMNIICAYNFLLIQKDLQLALPDWYTDEIYEKIQRANEFYLATLSWTRELKRLNGGTLVRQFLENMRLARRKLYMYASHDKNLHAVVAAHNLTLGQYPDYGSAVIIEKLKDGENNRYVRLLLWIGEPKKLMRLEMPGCAEICPLSRYEELVAPIVPTDEDMRCLFQGLEPKDLERIFDTDSVEPGSA